MDSDHPPKFCLQKGGCDKLYQHSACTKLLALFVQTLRFNLCVLKLFYNYFLFNYRRKYNMHDDCTSDKLEVKRKCDMACCINYSFESAFFRKIERFRRLIYL